MIKDLLKNLVIKTLKSQKNWPSFDVYEITIEKPANQQFGDYATNIAFRLAKQLGKPPQEIAQFLADEISKIKPAEIVKVEANDGYVNFFLSSELLRQSLADIYKTRGSFGKLNIGRKQKIIVEYSQPNIAKQMHIGHLRTTVLGDALANIYEMLGYKVIRWNYLGDWGTQFGKLITAYKLWSVQLRGSASKYLEAEPLSNKKQLTIRVLTELYVKFHKELKEHPELERQGQEEFAKLEASDKENHKLWEWFRKLSIKEFENIYKTLGVNFDIWLGESNFEKDLKPLVNDLRKREIAEIGEEGAIIIKLDRFNLPPALIQKADGASLYLTRDIATLKYRLAKYKPAKLLYVVGNEQSLHFEQLFMIAKVLDLNTSQLLHIKFGLVLGEDKKKMSTREGEAIPLEEVVEKAISLARDIVEKKSPNIAEKEKYHIAQTVALGALKYEMLKEHRNSDIVFSWDKMLDFSGNSAPYLQYTYARLSSILQKAGWTWRLSLQGRLNLSKLGEKTELAIMKHLLDFPEVITDSARTNLTNNLALYVYELANLSNQFYETSPILKDDNTSRRNARLVLIQTTASVLKSGLNLLGIEVLNKI
ncbi:MAG: arginine--tRNA ligase [Candidatus Yanofskybacteria bacterium]|nr:arginine--tRNA ligase [Candidatus Yanofskybacteria bacterium]